MTKSLLRATVFLACMAVAAPALHAQEALRPEVGKPLAKAEAFMRARRFPEAMAQLRAADAARGKTANEEFVIEETHGAIARASGDNATAARIYQDMLASGRVPESQQGPLLLAEASIAYEMKNYAAVVTWAQRYMKAGGNTPEMRTLLIQAYYLQGDYANAGKLQAAVVAGEIRAGHRPTEQQLQLLATCQRGSGDMRGFHASMVQLVTYYPKPDYWQNLIHDVQAAPGFADRLTFDIYRLELVLGLMKSPDDYMEMAELALQVPLPGEAKEVVDAGYKFGILGTGDGAPRHERLRTLVTKTFTDNTKTLAAQTTEAQADRDHNHLEAMGEEYVSYGQFDQGIPMIAQAIQLDDLRHPEDAKLHLGLAYLKAGNKPKAMQALRSVAGRDGTAGLAQLWLLYLSQH